MQHHFQGITSALSGRHGSAKKQSKRLGFPYFMCFRDKLADYFVAKSGKSGIVAPHLTIRQAH
jgi:hypothetical protein